MQLSTGRQWESRIQRPTCSATARHISASTTVSVAHFRWHPASFPPCQRYVAGRGKAACRSTNPNVPNVNGSARPITPALLEYEGPYPMGKSRTPRSGSGQTYAPSSADVSCSFDGWLYDQLNYYQLFAKVGRALSAASRPLAAWAGSGTTRTQPSWSITSSTRPDRRHTTAGLRFINGTALGGRTVSLPSQPLSFFCQGPMPVPSDDNNSVLTLPSTWGLNYDRSAPSPGCRGRQTVRARPSVYECRALKPIARRAGHGGSAGRLTECKGCRTPG